MVSASGALIERIHIARGGLVSVPIASINRSAAIWGEDAKLFNPERWLDDRGGLPPEASKVQGYRHLLTFADGPRTYVTHSSDLPPVSSSDQYCWTKRCLGRQFAVVELKASTRSLIGRSCPLMTQLTFLPRLQALLAVLLRRYTFALPGGPTTKIGEHRGFLPRPKVAGEQGSRVPMIIKRIE